MIDLTDIPERLSSPVQMTAPNQTVPIYTGMFSLIADRIELMVEGSILFAWLPKPKIQFSGGVKSGPPMQQWYNVINFDLQINGVSFGKAGITSREIITVEVKGTCLSGVLGNRDVTANKIRFAIPNVMDFVGFSIRDVTTNKIENARLNFPDDTFEVTIDKVRGNKQYRELLVDQGGYMLLYAGEINKKDGSDISWEEWQAFILRFSFFLYFLNGLRTSPLFASAANDEAVIWQDYTPYQTDRYKWVVSWADIILGNTFQNAWNSWNRLWKDENDKGFLQTAVHWYVEANTQNYVECAIVLAQNALELIYNWLIVETRGLITAQAARNMPAADKIRQLLGELTVAPTIPASFHQLAAMEGATDGPAAFVLIRNALVHGNESKRQRLATISIEAQYE